MSQVIGVIIPAVVGWGLCGATIGVGRKFTTTHKALIIHAIAAPLIFVMVSAVYFRCGGNVSPVATAGMFVAVVIFLDVFVIAMLVERNLDMFRSILGTWLPFALIFIATWATGTVLAAQL